MLPFELVATATDSPRDSPGGSLRKFATVVNGISGTPVIVAFACANAEPVASVRTAHVEARIRVIECPLSRAEPIPVVAENSIGGRSSCRFARIERDLLARGITGSILRHVGCRHRGASRLILDACHRSSRSRAARNPKVMPLPP